MDKITKLNKWLKQHNFKTGYLAYLEVEESPDTFCYDSITETIYYTDDLSSYDYICDFVKDINKKARRVVDHDLTYDIRTLAFLHELGHAQTWDDGNDFDYWLDTAIAKIELGKIEFINRIKNKIYMRSPMEVKATDWAVLFMLLNPGIVKELDDIIKGE